MEIEYASMGTHSAESRRLQRRIAEWQRLKQREIDTNGLLPHHEREELRELEFGMRMGSSRSVGNPRDELVRLHAKRRAWGF
jgi:hypothetical protein